MELTLRPEEAALLKQILTNYLSERRMEIASTDDRHLREKLHQEEAAITDLIARLEQATARPEAS